jgi:hypothetical protein
MEHDDLEEQFRRFKALFTSNMVAMGITDNAKKAAYFMGELPEEAQKILIDYDFEKNARDKNSIEDMIKIVLEAKKKNTSQMMASHRFFGKMIREGEKFEEFYKEIKSLADRCGFGELKDRFIHDRIIQAHYDKKFQRELLSLDDKATLDQVIQLCKKYEDSKMAVNEFSGTKGEVDAVKTKNPTKNKKDCREDRRDDRRDDRCTDSRDDRRGEPGPSGYKGSKKEKGEYRPFCKCRFCGLEHKWGMDYCPAYGKRCGRCGKMNHAMRACTEEDPKPQLTHAVSDDEDQYMPDHEQGDAVREDTVATSSDEEVLRGHSPKKPKVKSEVVKPDLRARLDDKHKLVKRLGGGQSSKSAKKDENKSKKHDKRGEPRATLKPTPSPEKMKTSKKPQERKKSPTPEWLKDNALNFEVDPDFDEDVINEPDEQADAMVSMICPKVWYENVAVDGRVLKMKVDSGCTTNVLSIMDFEKMRLDKKKIRPTTVKLVTYLKNVMDPVGEYVGVISLRRKKIKAKFILIQEKGTPLLGCPTGVELGLFKIESSSILRFPHDKISDQAEHTDELLLPCEKKVNISLMKDTRPISIPARRVPLAIKDQVFEELKRMERMGVIRPVSEPRPWCHAMVVGHKPNGKLRICLDPWTINPFIAREEHMLPDIDNLIMGLEDAKVMSVIDLEAGFWQVEVDDESAKLLTFATPWG